MYQCNIQSSRYRVYLLKYALNFTKFALYYKIGGVNMHQLFEYVLNSKLHVTISYKHVKYCSIIQWNTFSEGK